MITIRIQQEAISDIEKKLDKMSKRTPAVLKKAINETAKQAKKDMLTETLKKYMIKIGSFEKSTQIKNATVNNLEAVISVKGTVQELIDFKVSATKKTTMAQVMTEGSMKEIKSKRHGTVAFVTRFESGHRAVVQRVLDKKYSSKGAEKRLKKYGPHADLTKIKKLFSISLPKMEEKVYGVLRPEIKANLKKNIEKHINLMLEG